MVAGRGIVRNYGRNNNSPATGTGFFFQPVFGRTFLVTNRHMVIEEFDRFFSDHLAFKMHTDAFNLEKSEDLIYLTLQSGLTPRLDEIELHALDKQKLLKYADKYPRTVRNALGSSLAFEHFAA